MCTHFLLGWMEGRVRVGVLGCTGTVGQRFLLLLSQHPQMEVVALGASDRSAGQPYRKACHWLMSEHMPDKYAAEVVVSCQPNAFVERQCRLVFSALDSSVASEVEMDFANAGIAVFSNAKNYRMAVDVPLVVPTVNPHHLHVIPRQRLLRQFPFPGCLVTNANCSSTGLCVALQPLHQRFGVREVLVITMQAVSGAGYPGVASMDILDNVVPHISGEEEKMETEPRKILGQLAGAAEGGPFTEANIRLSAHCNRVPVSDGHTECVSVRLERPCTPEEAVACMRAYQAPVGGTHSLPQTPLVVLDETDVARPQPKLDRMAGNGFAVTVGRVRACPIFGLKFVLLSHNTVLGAAGGALLNAEIALAQGLV